MKDIFRKTILTFYTLVSILFMFIFTIVESITITIKANVTDIIVANSTQPSSPPTDDTSISPYNERVVVVMTYFGFTLLVCIPGLMCILCIYKMKGTAPCNFREAFCNCW